jgi:hypothetical protein
MSRFGFDCRVRVALAVAILLGLTASWVLAFSAWLSFLLPIPLCVAFGLSLWWVRSWRTLVPLGLAFGIASPFSPGVWNATLDYAHGMVSLRGAGLYGDQAFVSVDRRWRTAVTTSGCQVSGDEWVWALPYNLTAMVWIAVVGPMRGAYTGAYPSWAAASAALGATPIEVSASDLRTDRVRLPDAVLHLPTGCGTALLAAAGPWWTDEDKQTLMCEEDRIQGTIVEGVVVLRLPSCQGVEPAGLVLLDPDQGRVIAADQGLYEPLELAACSWVRRRPHWNRLNDIR